MSFNTKRSNMSFEATKKVLGATKLYVERRVNANKAKDGKPDFIFLNIVDEDGITQTIGQVSTKIRTAVDGKADWQEQMPKNLVISEIINDGEGQDGSSFYSVHTAAEAGEILELA